MFYAALIISGFIAALMPVTVWENEFFLAAVILVSGAAAIAAYHAQAGQISLPSRRDILGLSALAFWALACFSVLQSEIPFNSFLFFCFFSALPLTYLTARWIPNKDSFFKITTIGIGAVLTAIAAFSLYQYFLMPDWLYNGSARWPFGDPNGLAGALSYGFFAAAGIMLGGKNRIISNAGLLLALLFIAAIFITGSRAALAAMIPALILLGVFARGFMMKHKKCALILIAGAAGIFFALNLHDTYDLPRPSESITDDYALISSRVAIWESVVPMIQGHFWAGTGIGTFASYYPESRRADTVSFGYAAHSDPLQFWAEMGIAAPFLFYTIIFLGAARTWRTLKHLPQDDPARLKIAVSFCAIMAMLIHTHVNFHFSVLPMLILTGLMAAYWRSQMPNQTNGTIISGRIVSYAILFPLFVFISFQSSNILIRRAETALAENDTSGFAWAVNMADRLSGGLNANAPLAAARINIAMIEHQTDAEKKNLIVQRAEKLLDRAENANRRLAEIPTLRAEIYNALPEQNSETKARQEEFLHKALNLNPLYSPARMAMADFLEAGGQKDLAYDFLMDGLKWPGGTPEFYQRLAFTALERGDIDTHVRAMQKSMRAQSIQGRNARRAGWMARD